MKKLLLSIFLLATILVSAQEQDALSFANHVDTTAFRNTIEHLSSKELEGRKSGDRRERLAAQYIIDRLQEEKIKPAFKGNYHQKIDASEKKTAEKKFLLDQFNYADCYTYPNKSSQDSIVLGDEIVFAGYGVHHSSFNDFGKVDLTNKIVMVINKMGPHNAFGVKCHSSTKVPDLSYIESQNPKAILLVRPGFDTFNRYSTRTTINYSETNNNELPRIQINELLANRILEPTGKTIKQIQFKSEETCAPVSLEFNKNVTIKGDYSYQSSNIGNVVALIEGEDLKEECVVLSTHFDHIGKTYNGTIYPGADDNASGVAGILEIARLFQKAKKAGRGPKRSLVILFNTAEEAGLYGSKFYIEHPLFSIENTTACVNIDMIGRIGSDYEDKDFASNYMMALTESGKIDPITFGIIDSINKVSTQMEVIGCEESKYGSLFSRSDHYSFHQQEVPSIFFTNGKHNDLHRTTDTPDKIKYHLMQKRTQLAFLTVWELCNNPHPLKASNAGYEEELMFEANEAD